MDIKYLFNSMKTSKRIPSPAHYQSFEKELGPVLPYLTGNVLNAGCGTRNINALLLNHGATSVENCDIKPSTLNAIICNLDNIPRPTGTYDSILCNAVMEHMQSPDIVMTEFRRLLKPGGHLVMAIPFLQPYHYCPFDYQRYTRDGLAELARSQAFEVVVIMPIHSLAQTISCILWSYFEEKKRLFLQVLFLIPLYIWCTISEKTDFSAINTANAYQVVLRKL